MSNEQAQIGAAQLEAEIEQAAMRRENARETVLLAGLPAREG